jgi:hypothetical protein
MSTRVCLSFVVFDFFPKLLLVAQRSRRSERRWQQVALDCSTFRLEMRGGSQLTEDGRFRGATIVAATRLNYALIPDP